MGACCGGGVCAACWQGTRCSECVGVEVQTLILTQRGVAWLKKQPIGTLQSFRSQQCSGSLVLKLWKRLPASLGDKHETLGRGSEVCMRSSSLAAVGFGRLQVTDMATLGVFAL